jgi:hypothetical protein
MSITSILVFIDEGGSGSGTQQQKMKSMHRGARKGSFGPGLLVAILLFGSVVARADVVLDWNAIAVNTAIANNQSPFAHLRPAGPEPGVEVGIRQGRIVTDHRIRNRTPIP